jgi:sugar phosphate isomerase/epimerase
VIGLRDLRNPWIDESNMNRRDFVKRSTVAGIASMILGSTNAMSKGSRWQIGCFNRPWIKWSLDQTLQSIRAAGYNTAGLLTRTKSDALIGADATPEYLQTLKARLASSGLATNMGAVRSRHDIPLDDSIREVRKQIDNARFLSLKYAMTFGSDKPEQFDHFCKVMKDAASYAEARGIKLAIKPHGGISGASDDMMRMIKEINHRNFSIWYDAGNIIYYTGKDPVAELDPIARHVTGFCAKDCGEPKGEVMIQFGAGKVDFPGVFKRLKSAGFNGPVMVECCKIGETPEETARNASANRIFLERLLASI